MKHPWIVIVAILVIGAIFLYGASLLGEHLAEKRFNDGYCQICEEKVIPIGNRYGGNYYCPNCCRWNE